MDFRALRTIVFIVCLWPSCLLAESQYQLYSDYKRPIQPEFCQSLKSLIKKVDSGDIQPLIGEPLQLSNGKPSSRLKNINHPLPKLHSRALYYKEMVLVPLVTYEKSAYKKDFSVLRENIEACLAGTFANEYPYRPGYELQMPMRTKAGTRLKFDIEKFGSNFIQYLKIIPGKKLDAYEDFCPAFKQFANEITNNPASVESKIMDKKLSGDWGGFSKKGFALNVEIPGLKTLGVNKEKTHYYFNHDSNYSAQDFIERCIWYSWPREKAGNGFTYALPDGKASLQLLAKYKSTDNKEKIIFVRDDLDGLYALADQEAQQAKKNRNAEREAKKKAKQEEEKRKIAAIPKPAQCKTVSRSKLDEDIEFKDWAGIDKSQLDDVVEEQDLEAAKSTDIRASSKMTAAVQTGHMSPVSSSFAISQDQALLATQSRDETIIWDIKSGLQISSFYTGYIFDDITFSKDNKELLTRNSRYYSRWDVPTGKLISSEKLQKTSNQKNKTGTRFTTSIKRSEGKIYLQEIDNGSRKELWKKAFPFDGFYDWKVSPDKKQLAYINRAGDLFILDLTQREKPPQEFKAPGEFQPYAKIIFTADNKRIILGQTIDQRLRPWHQAKILIYDRVQNKMLPSTDQAFYLSEPVYLGNNTGYLYFESKINNRNYMIVWDVENQELVSKHYGMSDIRWLKEVGDGSIFFTTRGTQKTVLWSRKQQLPLKTFEGSISNVQYLFASADGEYLGVADRGSLLMLNLENATTSTSITSDGKHPGAMFVEDNSKAWFPSWRGLVQIDVSTGKQQSFAHLKDSSGNNFKRTRVSGDGSVAVMHSKKELAIFDLNKKQFIANYCFTGWMSGLSYDGKKLLVGRQNNKGLELWDLEKGKNLLDLDSELYDDYNRSTGAAFSPDGKYLALGFTNGLIKVLDTKKWKPRYQFQMPQKVTHLEFSPDSQELLSSGTVTALWNLPKAKLDKVFWNGSKDGMHQAIFIPGKNKVVTMGNNYLIKGDPSAIIWDKNSGQMLSKVFMGHGDSYVLMTKDGYYTAAKDTSDLVAFVEGQKAYSFDNFDLAFNRPDKVLQALGSNQAGTIESLQLAYAKRLKKMGFDPDTGIEELQLPLATIVAEQLPDLSQSRDFELLVKAEDSQHLLQKINVYVNGVPVFGRKGIVLGNQQKSLQKHIKVPLEHGANKVQVSVVNSQGLESLRDTIEVQYSAPKFEKAVYLLAVGVSDYQGNEYDLRYAAKDATDIIKYWGKRDKGWPVHTRLLTDKQVTRESILEARQFLEQASIDDTVIVFIAGHGLLDDKLDYYFATADIDFDRPQKRGVSYEEIETLLDGLAARKKLLLMDTCFSGETDEALFASNVTSNANPAVSVRSFRGIKRKNRGANLQLKTVYQLMQQNFTDLRRGTGAVVISSAGGAEFAFEGEQWKNGVFTYALLKSLREKSFSITVSDLQKKVIEKVTELTDGRQTPTGRRVNIESDFAL